MNPDWGSFDARTRGLSARSEADLIRDLAAARARAARRHKPTCTCPACRIRRIDTQRRALAAAVNANAKAGAQ